MVPVVLTVGIFKENTKLNKNKNNITITNYFI